MQQSDVEYIDKIMAEPNIPKDDEQELWARVANGDECAIETVTKAYLKLVVSIATKYKHQRGSLMECIQEGTLGLLSAIKKYDYSKGYEFSTFARHDIRYRIQDYQRRMVSISNIITTKRDRTIFCNWNKYIGIGGTLDEETIELMSTELNVPKKDVVMMETKLMAINSNVSLSPSDDSDGDRDNRPSKIVNMALASNYEVPDVEYEKEYDTEYLSNKLQTALSKLGDRQRDIIESRYMTDEKVRLKDLSEKYSVSMERIRQVECATLTELKQTIQQAC